jgi:cytochrome bd-type quinol oxidase subunit 2
MNMLSPPGVLFHYLRVFLGARLAAVREDGDRGASAVELAVITAVLVALAVLILGIIVTFAKNQGTNITNTNVPNPANNGN